MSSVTPLTPPSTVRRPSRGPFGWVVGIVLIAACGWSLPAVREQLLLALGKSASGHVTPTAASSPAHVGHDHAHASHAEEHSLELSNQARDSIGLREGPVALSAFDRTISVPGIVVERRGRSKIDIIAPMTGYVTKIHPTEGEAVSPDQALFEVRLTHEELVQAQADLLRTTEELDVVRREIARLESISEGVIAMKTVLERKYEQQKQEAVHRAQRQALLLHGLTEPQVESILKTRTLLSTITVRAPSKANPTPVSTDEVILQVQELKVEHGQHVTVGDTLAVLTDHRELLIEGEAFEQDAPHITQAVADDTMVTAILEGKVSAANQIGDLHMAYVANRVDLSSRALHFYVILPNQTVRDTRDTGSQRFVEWRYKPGQRMQLRVPVERWTERIVLPTDAVAQEGVENYVFRANGARFDRQAVRVEYRDPQSVVIANDGSIFPGERIALSAAQQLQLALKNKAGGGVDPHAGHNH